MRFLYFHSFVSRLSFPLSTIKRRVFEKSEDGPESKFISMTTSSR